MTEDGSVYLACDLGNMTKDVETVTVTTDALGIALEPELPFENPDGTPLCIENDFYGNPHPSGRMTVGPFEGLRDGKQKIKVADIR